MPRISRKTKFRRNLTNDVLGIIMILLGLIIVVFSKGTDTGIIGKNLYSLLQGLFGTGKYFLGLAIICSGFVMVINNESKLTTKIIESFIFTIFISSIFYMGHGMTEGKNIRLSQIGLAKYISETYNFAIEQKNSGGSFGGVIASMFKILTGPIATYIIIYFIAIIFAFTILGIKFSKVIHFLKNVFKKLILGLIEVIANIRNNMSETTQEKKERLAKENEIRKQKGEKLVQELKVNEKDNYNQIEFVLNEGNKKNAEINRDELFAKQKENKEDKNIKEVLQLEHAIHHEEENYIFPSLELLKTNNGKDKGLDKKEIHDTAIKLQKTLASFGVEAKVTNVTHGPAVTRYELTPSTGVKVSKIVNLTDDIALNLAAKSIRMEAPIPGKAAVGIEIPNKENEMVYLRDVLQSDVFKNNSSKLSYALGKDVAGDIIIGDIAKMPHMLIAGSTGSGKSVCINSLITSILYKSKPSEVKLLLIDPKMVELSGYNGIPHLLIPVVTDPKKAAGALNWAVQEMVNRYTLFANNGVKDIKGYNEVMKSREENNLPQIVIIIDELADLMMVAPNDVEDAICRLAQMARAAGMHLVIATQRPSVDVITGIIKANIPSRIAFAVSSQVDSRTILDNAGAEHLLGKGDMLYFPVGENKPIRIQGTFVSEKEVEQVVESIKLTSHSHYDENIIDKIDNCDNKGQNNLSNDADEFLHDAIDMVVELGQASASMIQRRFKVGYSRAGRIIDQMESRGIISGYEGSKPRQVLISKEKWQELKMGDCLNENESED